MTPYTPATSPPNFNVPQPHSSSPVQQSQPAPGAMGPPPKPEKEEKEKITDIGDISDVVFGSGIDLREEENYIANTYRNTHGAPSFNSFESGTTIASPNNSFNQLAQANYGSHPAFAGSGPLSQPATSQESIEQEINRKHKAAAQAQAQKQQQHLNDPFLLGDTVRQRLHRLAYEQGVHLNIDGLFDPKPPLVPQGVTATGPDGTGIAAVKAKPIVQENAPFADILALISLAANERLRGLMDEAYTLSRNRRFQDASPERFGATEAGVQASTALPDTLNRLSLEDQQREAERLRRRAQRAANVPATDAIKTENASEAATPDPAASVAPEKPMTKKERERQAKMGQTEEALHKNANTTAAMQLGLGRKGKKYSWMTGGVAAAPINPYKASPKPAAVLTSAPTAGGKAAIGPGTAAEGGKVKERKWGGWNEAGLRVEVCRCGIWCSCSRGMGRKGRRCRGVC
ncbi:hypothetical protein H2203_002675 [Taxawa tesnikishii (nom. ined.)]|nr:hypothetical protein H2203_002675 [Dothideales sp. JES 119]